MANDNSMTNDRNPKYDLEERTAQFGEAIIDLSKSVRQTFVNKPIINQLIRSATSVGANYMEADVAESKTDFRHKIGICKKEAKETLHWLRMLSRAAPEKQTECRKLWREAHELLFIFSAILKRKY